MTLAAASEPVVELTERLTVGRALIVSAAEEALFTTGLDETTRTLYAVDVLAPAGITKEIGLVPTCVAVGIAKEPVASESCAVKVFPALNVPVVVKGTLIVSPAQ